MIKQGFDFIKMVLSALLGWIIDIHQKTHFWNHVFDFIKNDYFYLFDRNIGLYQKTILTKIEYGTIDLDFNRLK